MDTPPDIGAKELGLIETAVKFVVGLMWSLSADGRVYLASRINRALGPELEEAKKKGK